jgi:succinoglycan biosynthesis transport protein ExoP
MTAISFPNPPLHPTGPHRGPSDLERRRQDAPLEALALSHYFWIFRRHAWQIALAVIVVGGLTALYCFRVQPLYEATSRITIDQRAPSSGLGQQDNPAGGSDIEQVITTEMQILQSDEVLRPVVEQFHLPVSGMNTAHPQNKNSGSTSPESAIGESAVVIPNYTVTHLPNSTLIDIHYRATDPRQAAAVANAIARSYIARAIEGRVHASVGVSEFMEEQISQLKKKMDDSATALAGYERQMGVINPDEKVSILTARLLQLNTQYTEAQNDRISKETEYQQIKSGTTPTSAIPLSGAALEVSSQAAALSRQEQQLHDAEEKLAVAKTVYGPNYAEYKRAANDVAELSRQYQQMRGDISKRIEVSYREAVNREDMLREALRQGKDESDRLNAHSAQYQELKREAEANKSLYDELYRKIKEAGINSGIESSSIRIADLARPPAYPVFPNKTLLIGSASIFALLLSMLVVLILDFTDKKLRDPDQVLRLTGMEVIGVLPNVRSFSSYHRPLTIADESTSAGKSQTEIVKDWASSEQYYRESIASLLSTILLSSAGGRLRSILVTSASAADGKSSCAAYLALEHASLGKKTLLIDADMRSPFHHRYFDLNNERGLHEAITEQAPLVDVRQHVKGASMLDIVVAGPTNPHMFRHVGRAVSELLRQATLEDYDLVVVDAPPMIGLTEPIEIACLTSGVLVVGDAKQTHKQDINAMYATLERLRVNVLGLVLNRFRPEASENFRQYRSYAIYAGRTRNRLA